MKISGILLFMLFSLQSYSQIYKTQWLIGGDASFASSSFGTVIVNNLELSPAVGYFIINKLATGLRANSNTETYIDGGKTRSSQFSLAPFIRYYILPKENKINLFTDFSYAVGWGRYNFFNRQPTANYTFNNISLMGGPSFFINEHTALEFTFGYSHTNRGTIDSINTSTIHFGIGLQIHFGKHYAKLPPNIR